MFSNFKKISLSWVVGGQALLVVLIVSVVSWQAHTVKSKIIEMADLKDPSPFTGSLVNDMNEVNIGLLSYGASHDPAVIDRIARAERHFEESLTSFQKMNPRLLPAAAQSTILDAFQPFKDLAMVVIHLGDQRNDKSVRLLNDQDDIVNSFEYRLRPLVKRSQPWAAVRIDLISNMENEARLVPEAMTRTILGRASEADENRLFERRFEKFLGVYERLAQSSAERRDLAHVRAIWEDMTELVVDITSLNQSRNENFAKFMEASKALHDTIVSALPPVRPEEIQQKKQALLHGIEILLAFSAILVLLGVGTCIASGLWMYRRLHAALDEVRAVTDAAITGDLSRQLADSSIELGGVPGSVNRLIGVLRRSEQLILQLGSIIESSGDASIGLTLEGTILSWNNAAYRMYGYTLEEVKGQPIEKLFPSNQSALFGMVAERLDQKRLMSCDTIHLRKSGVPVNVRMTLSRIFDTHGRPIGLSMLCRDLNPPATSDGPASRSSESKTA